MQPFTFPRRLKIGNSYNRAKSQEYHVAEIRLAGLWLEELGFLEGNFFTVSIEGSKLILSPDPPPSSEEMKHFNSKVILNE